MPGIARETIPANLQASNPEAAILARGASSIARLPTEAAMTEQIKTFKPIAFG